MQSETIPHDAAYKDFFTDRNMVKSLLSDFAPPELLEDLDLDTLEKYPDGYVADNLERRRSDAVWRIKSGDGWRYILIMLEFQSSQDRWMALRVLAYTALLWEDLIKRDLIKAGGRLPPVLPVVIYNGESKWSAAERVQDLVEPSFAKLMEYQPEQKYLLIDVNRISASLLDSAEGESAFLFRFERAKNPGEILAIAREMALRLQDPKYDFLRRTIGKWLGLLLRKRSGQEMDFRFEAMGDTTMLEERLAKWEEEIINKSRAEGMAKGRAKGKAEGIKEGKAEGIKEGKAEGILEGLVKGKAEGILEGRAEGVAESLKTQKKALLSMLSLRFPDYPREWEEYTAALMDAEAVGALMIALMTVKSADEFGELIRKDL